MMGNYCIHLIGVDAQNNCRIQPEMVNACQSVVISERIKKQLLDCNIHLESKEIIPIAPVSECFERIEASLISGNVGVFASGDPLFFGIARRLIEKIGPERVKISPALSSIQYACAAFKVPWDDMTFVSVHGRGDVIPLGQIISHDKIALLTDSICSPDAIAREIIGFIGDERSARYQVYIAENIGLHNEQFIETTLADAASCKFSALCCMLLVRSCLKPTMQRFGLEEDDIVHSRGLITKNEVRSAALHSLALLPDSIMWDIGAGSGSVSVEAARLVPDLLVFAIEKEHEQHANIIANKKKFDLFNVKLVQGKAPDVLDGLPVPDRIFIGGSGGNLPEIINFCAEILPDGGRIVISAVLEKTRSQGPTLLLEKGFKVVTKTICVSREAFPGGEEFTFNPITLIVGLKKAKTT